MEPSAGNAPTKLLATGGIVAALGALGAVTSCCLLPAALVGLGFTGAWVGDVDALAPYRILFSMATVGFVGSGLWLAYRRPKEVCAADGACARSRSAPAVRGALVLAALLLAASYAFPYVQPWLL